MWLFCSRNTGIKCCYFRFLIYKLLLLIKYRKYFVPKSNKSRKKTKYNNSETKVFPFLMFVYTWNQFSFEKVRFRHFEFIPGKT